MSDIAEIYDLKAKLASAESDRDALRAKLEHCEELSRRVIRHVTGPWITEQGMFGPIKLQVDVTDLWNLYTFLTDTARSTETVKGISNGTA